LQALDPREKIKVQDELKSICEYACLQDSGSVFLSVSNLN